MPREPDFLSLFFRLGEGAAHFSVRDREILSLETRVARQESPRRASGRHRPSGMGAGLLSERIRVAGLGGWNIVEQVWAECSLFRPGCPIRAAAVGWNVWNRLERFSGGCSLFHPAGRGRGRMGARGRGTSGDACRTLLGRLRLIVLSWMAVCGKGGVEKAWRLAGGAASGAVLCPVPDTQNGDAGRRHVKDDDIGVDGDQFPRTVSPKAATVREVGEAFRSTPETERHAPGGCWIEMADIAADRDQIGNGGRSEDYFHDGAGRSSAVPQLSSQLATSRRGIV